MALTSINVPATDIRRATDFYNYLFSEDLRENQHAENAEGTVASVNQAVFTISSRNDENETTACYFEVSDMDEAIAALEARGGKLIAEPFPLAVKDKTARAAIVADPDGNGVGIFTAS